MKVAKSIYAGAGLALTAGLLMGAAMKPNLGDDDRPIGPQIFAGWSGVRSTGPFDGGDLAFAAYSAQIPDYVIGKDWARLSQPVAWRPNPESPSDDAYEAPAPVETPTFSRATYEEPPREAPSFPSMDGGRSYDAPPAPPTAPVAKAAPAPRQQLAELDDDAPPEATGDTSVN